ncbi:hypothetical protein B0T17DRAFT_530220 [Bombardia bombarda]|uniref:HNH nuclease domain-containing protein n=1 Tax=Bombardia bombarda TaxID=252184 RepID=A0AA39XBZ7_9PEZI|nr:hypothetical protein B0T17DRAFT_530220 [Bombardia bombarda]
MSDALRSIGPSSPRRSLPRRGSSESPEGSPPTMAIRPLPLGAIEAKYEAARQISVTLAQDLKELKSKLKPNIKPDKEIPILDAHENYQLVELAERRFAAEQEAIRFQKEVISKKREIGELTKSMFEKSTRQLNQRFISMGDSLWQYRVKKACLETPSSPRLIDSRFSKCLLVLYQTLDPSGKKTKHKRPRLFRENAIKWYDAQAKKGKEGNDLIWCHVSCAWYEATSMKAAHIVPHFVSPSFGEILFGSTSEAVDQPGNALLLHQKIEGWFDKHQLVIVPVDANTLPITKWQTDIISPSILHTQYDRENCGRHLHERELEFKNEKRPVSRFMYFHFIMTLIRIKDLKQDGWEKTWAKYHYQRPFPTPGPYMRQSMLLALATYIDVTDLNIVDSWIRDNGFESQLSLSTEEATEAARRVIKGMEDVDDDGSEDSESEDSESEDGSSESS